LRKSGSGGAERSNQGIGLSLWDMDGQEGCFVVVDGKAGSTFKELRNFFCGSNGSHAGAKED
jgi:hypothetical protein